MEEKNKRNKYLKIRVSEEEMDAIKRKFQNSGMDTLSGFVRAMIFEGYIVQMDENEMLLCPSSSPRDPRRWARAGTPYSPCMRRSG